MIFMSELEKYREAGKIAKKVKKFLMGYVKPGCLLLDIAETCESMIREEGGQPAFPCNIGINNIAAHWTPLKGEKVELGEEIIKIDFGVHVDGYIADTAFTLDFSGRYKDLVDCVKKSLDKAIKMCKPGMHVSKIGGVIEKVIRDGGYQPIINLTGHLLKRYDLHAGLTIPNVEKGEGILEEGMVIAVEPFGTPGKGIVQDQANPRIFRYLEKKPVRLRASQDILKRIEGSNLPFTPRWFDIPSLQKRLGINELVKVNAIYQYPILAEKDVVAQAEDTLIVGEKPEVIT
jgi:methionyl aminopeptidase